MMSDVLCIRRRCDDDHRFGCQVVGPLAPTFEELIDLIQNPSQGFGTMRADFMEHVIEFGRSKGLDPLVMGMLFIDTGVSIFHEELAPCPEDFGTAVDGSIIEILAVLEKRLGDPDRRG